MEDHPSHEDYLENRVRHLEAKVEELSRAIFDSDARMHDMERTLTELLREKLANVAVNAVSAEAMESAGPSGGVAVLRSGELAHTPRKRRHVDVHTASTLKKSIRNLVDHAEDHGLPKFKFSDTINSKYNRETIRLLANAVVSDPSFANEQGERPSVDVVQDTLIQYFKSKRDRRNESSTQIAQHNIEARRKQRRQRRTKERITTAGNLLHSAHVPPELARFNKDEDLTQHPLFSLLASSEYETEYEEDEAGNLQKTNPVKYCVKIPSWRSAEASQILHFLDTQRGSGSQQRLEYNHDEAEIVAARRPEKIPLDSWMVDTDYREVVAHNNIETDPRDSKAHRYTSMDDERATLVVDLQARVNALRREAESLSPSLTPVVTGALAFHQPGLAEGDMSQLKDDVEYA